MASKKKKTSKKKSAAAAGASAGNNAQKRKKKAVSRRNEKRTTVAPPLPSLVVRRPAPAISSKYTTYFEIVENKDKKKKLEFQVTTDRVPPPGFDFVPIGNPDLTKACKELSREQDAMIFIVSAMDHEDGSQLGLHMNRVGHHIRRTIVEQARVSLGQPPEYTLEAASDRQPEPIPETQEEINAQADAAIRDLFPRMPNTDRQTIIDRSFRKGGGETVGLASNLTLSRRVQLAVLAHIRHTHTTYDDLWRKHGWAQARKAIEATCLDFIVKWRGDEETGRDQLDEILREVIVISDSEDTDDGGDDDDEDDDDDSDEEDSETEDSDQTEDNMVDASKPLPRGQLQCGPDPHMQNPALITTRDPEPVRLVENQRLMSLDPVGFGVSSHRRLNSANFRRYEAAAQSRWQQAQERVRHGRPPPLGMQVPVATSAPAVGHSDAMEYTYTQPHPRQSHEMHTRPPPEHGVERRPNYRLDVASENHPNSGTPLDLGSRHSPMTGFHELKDLLVPSIEPRSPDSLTSPVFVRTVPPRIYTRDSPAATFQRRPVSPTHANSSSLSAHRRDLDYAHPGQLPAPGHRYEIARGPAVSGPTVGFRDPVLLDHREQVAETRPYRQQTQHMHSYRSQNEHYHAQIYAQETSRVESGRVDGSLLRTERNPILVENWERRLAPAYVESIPMSSQRHAVLMEGRGRQPEFPAATLVQHGDPYRPVRDPHSRSLAPLSVTDPRDRRVVAYTERTLDYRDGNGEPGPPRTYVQTRHRDRVNSGLQHEGYAVNEYPEMYYEDGHLVRPAPASVPAEHFHGLPSQTQGQRPTYMEPGRTQQQQQPLARGVEYIQID